jgi:two-component system, OmpR family, sensor histidine kinase ChvG
LPSALAEDEIGDLSRSFSGVLQQLGEYNEYLRTLASKLSHELRTPLAIVTSSLENLEHEPLDETSLGYTARAREGADRLRNILNAMSEASRVEELIKNAEPERFDLRGALASATEAYRDVYANRRFEFDADSGEALMSGSPELLIQMLDKLVDNAVDFSADGDTIRIGLEPGADSLRVSVTNPGPPLPERMRSQLFDSMVSVRAGKDSRHLGLGLYIAKLIAEGHGGTITADNVDGGVAFTVAFPRTGRSSPI